jgi:hypothetical protein
MSRGPGRIERAIRALFDAHPDRAFPSFVLVFECSPISRHPGTSTTRASSAAGASRAYGTPRSAPEKMPLEGVVPVG